MHRMINIALLILLCSSVACSQKETTPEIDVELLLLNIERRLAIGEEEFKARWGELPTVSSLAPLPLEDKENQALSVIAALQLYDQICPNEIRIFWAYRPDNDSATWEIERDARWKQILEKCGSVLDHLDPLEAKGRSNYTFEYNSFPVVSRENFFSLNLIRLADMLVARGQLQPDIDVTLDSVAMVFALKDSLSREPSGTLQIMHYALDIKALALSRSMLERPDLSDEKLLLLESWLPPSESPVTQFRILGEGLEALNSLSNLSSDLIGQGLSEKREDQVLALAKLRTLKRIDNSLNFATTACVDRVPLPPSEINEDFVPRYDGVTVEAQFIKAVDVLLDIQFGGLERLITEQGDFMRARRRLARIAFKVERYARENGGVFPVSLEEVGLSDMPAEVRIDPFTSQPFEYRLSDTGYILTASENAFEAVQFLNDPILDWSRPAH